MVGYRSVAGKREGLGREREGERVIFCNVQKLRKG